MNKNNKDWNKEKKSGDLIKKIKSKWLRKRGNTVVDATKGELRRKTVERNKTSRRHITC